MSGSFTDAVETITPLQARVLHALDGEGGYSADEVARRAELGRWERKRNTADGEASWEYRGPDRITARNVLGWLASKGMARRIGGRWWRVFPSENPLTLVPTLSHPPLTRIEGQGLGQEAQSAKSPVRPLREAA